MTLGDSQARSADADDVADEMATALGATVGNFASRLNRRLQEKAQEETASEKAASERHARIFQAMTTIRKALQETCKIKLGDRFSFGLEVSDLKGWPKVDLRLVDKFAPKRVDYCLSVSAHDRQELGAIEIRTHSGDLRGHVHLKDPAEFKKIPYLLKKAVRSYLDEVAQYVLNPVRPEDLVEQQTKALEVEEDQEPDHVSHKLKQANVFSEDPRLQSSNSVAVDEGEVNALDEIPMDHVATSADQPAVLRDREESEATEVLTFD